MSSLIVHGCYDHETLTTLLSLGIRKIGFDCRARSAHFTKTRDLEGFLANDSLETAFLIFEDESIPVIDSYLSILKSRNQKITLEFRDRASVSYYQKLSHSFFWMFHPSGEWRQILTLKNCKGVILPLEHKEFYQENADLWSLIEGGQLDVYLHSGNSSELSALQGDDLKLSLDIGPEVEPTYRRVNQLQLRNLRLWESHAHSSR